MHLGLKTGPLCPLFCTKLKEPCSFSKVPDGSQSIHGSPVTPLKFQMTPRLVLLMSSASKKKRKKGSPVKEPSFKVPFMESLAERCPTTRVLLHSPIEIPGTRVLPHLPGSPRVERGPHGERCPYPETFLTYLPGFPVKELPQPPRPPPRSLFRERRSIPRVPFIHLSKSPAEEPPSRFPI